MSDLATSKIDDIIGQLRDEISVLTATSDTAYLLDHHLNQYKYISPSIRKLLGFDVEQMQQIDFSSLIIKYRIVTKKYQHIKLRELDILFHAGATEKREVDYLLRTKNGGNIWVSDVALPLKDNKNNVIGAVGVLRDISERINFENSTKNENDSLNKSSNDLSKNISFLQRNEFFQLLEMEIKRVERSDNFASLLLVNIDNFSKFEENIASKILSEVVRVINTSIRDIDVIASLGGGEVGIILPETDQDGAYFVAERIRNDIMRSKFNIINDDNEINCTISIGISSIESGSNATSSSIYKTAGTRLYIAKNTGSNKVSVDEIYYTH